MKWFTIKDLVFIALIGALIFALNFFLGVGLIALTGTPLVGGLVTMVLTIWILVSGGLIVRKFGFFTLVLLIHGILSTPTINLGPPGVYKILVVLVLGIIADTFLFFTGYKKISYYIATVLGTLALVPFMWWMMILFGIPGADRLGNLLLILMIVYVIEAIIGCWLGILTYNKKLKNSRIVRMLDSS